MNENESGEQGEQGESGNDYSFHDSEISTIEKLTQVNREATKYDFDQMELSRDTENAENSLDPELLNAADTTSLFEYEQTHLNKRYKGLLKAMTPDEIICWQNKLLSKSLIKLPGSLEDIALQLFKNLMSYMGDRSSSKNPFLHVIKHTRLAMKSPEEIKDEAYLQVIKQITRNPNPTRCLRGWNLLAVMSSIYPPSMDLFHALIHFLLGTIKTGDENLAKRANYIAIRLSHTFESRRKFSPSDEEVRHIEAMKPIMLPIYFYSGAATTVPCESYTTVRDLKTMVMRKLQLNVSRVPFFSLFEVCIKPDRMEERYINESDKVCDLLSVWQREIEDAKKKNLKWEFKMYLKLLLYYKFNEEDLDSVTMHYVQTNFEVVKGRMIIDEALVVKLAAVQLFINSGHKKKADIEQDLKTDIRNYVAPRYLKQSTPDIWVAKILSEYASVSFRNQLEARKGYLELIKDNDLYQSSQFMCVYNESMNTKNNNSQGEINPHHIPKECIVGIKPEEVVITDKQRNKIYSIPLTSLASWGVNTENFVLVEKKSDREFSKSYFDCTQTKLLKIMLDSYSDILAGKNVIEIMTETQATCKMFETMKQAQLKPGESFRTRQATAYLNDEE